MTEVLSIKGLRVAASTRFGESKSILRDIDLCVAAGQVHAVVGESGSGKTMLARAVVDLLPAGITRTSGTIHFEQQPLTTLDARQMRALRGPGIGYVFQEPMLSLNPVIPVGRQMAEGLALHTDLSRDAIRARCLEMLRKVSIRDPEAAFTAYPHEYSGGMRQRIMLASVLALKPRLLIADEPTTALDAIIQRDVLDLMIALANESGTAILLITHDFGLVGEYADVATVMRLGEVVEHGTVRDLFRVPRADYTRMLLSASPVRRPRPHIDRSGTPLVEISNLDIRFHGKKSWPWRVAPQVRAVRDVSLAIAPGENLAVVGESGSGKTTIGRALLGLVDVHGGDIAVEGVPVDYTDPARRRKLRETLQVVFQDPASSLDPRFRVDDLIAEGRPDLKRKSSAYSEAVNAALEDVGLTEDYADRFPHELSGGQKQRVAIARAIIMRPKLIVADEPVSALDLTVQAKVLDLMTEIQERHGFSYFFVSHDLGVVEQIADRIIVMRAGRIVEMADRDTLFDRPMHPYTRRLLDASVEVVPKGSGFTCHRRDQRRISRTPSIAGAYESGDDYCLGEVGPGHFVAYHSQYQARDKAV